MKISTRLSFRFSIISCTIFIVFGLTVYILSSMYRSRDFQGRLKKRVEITEKIFLEKESFTPSGYEKITNQFLHTLPNETEEVIELNANLNPIFKYKYSKEVKEGLLANSVFDFEMGRTQGVGKVFHVKKKDYLIIVTAIDEIGLQNLSYLLNIIILLVLTGIPLIFLGSFIITKRALLPISRKILKANNISASNLDQRLNVVNPDDEIGKMAIAFNNLLDRLEESFDAQKSFIRNASHEIRNPLTAIMGEAEVTISKPRTNEEYVDSVTIILAEAEILNLTVNNLLQLSKISANQFSIQMGVIQFDLLLEEIKTSYDFANGNNQIILYIANEEDGFLTSGNRNLLKTAINNLFDNACKFSSNNPVKVLLTKEEGKLHLVIKDKGIGIPIKDLEKVKVPFYRCENAIGAKGSGVGLSLTYKIIALHQGELRIESQVGIGTEIFITLPLISVK